MTITQRNKCEVCGAENNKPHPKTYVKVVLIMAYLDYNPLNDVPDNLMTMCQRCYLRHDEKHRKKTKAKEQQLKDGGQLSLF